MSSFTGKNVVIKNVLINLSPKSYLKNQVFESIKDKLQKRFIIKWLKGCCQTGQK